MPPFLYFTASILDRALVLSLSQPNSSLLFELNWVNETLVAEGDMSNSATVSLTNFLASSKFAALTEPDPSMRKATSTSCCLQTVIRVVLFGTGVVGATVVGTVVAGEVVASGKLHVGPRQVPAHLQVKAPGPVSVQSAPFLHGLNQQAWRF